MKTKYLVIGAGISGLTFANYAKEDYLVVEKKKKSVDIVEPSKEMVMFGIMQVISFILTRMSSRKIS